MVLLPATVPYRSLLFYPESKAFMEQAPLSAKFVAFVNSNRPLELIRVKKCGSKFVVDGGNRNAMFAAAAILRNPDHIDVIEEVSDMKVANV